MITLAGISIPVCLRFPETALSFQTRYFAKSKDRKDLTDQTERLGQMDQRSRTGQQDQRGPTMITERDWDYYKSENILPSPQSEFSMLTAHLSNALLPFDRVIMHAAALRWRDKAYLITAPSGTGKSTQARFLQELRPHEFSIICGDRPVLQFCSSEHGTGESENLSSQAFPPEAPQPCLKASQPAEANEAHSDTHLPAILVHPSPWNGKENWYGAEAAPLAGIIHLKRGDENSLTRPKPRDLAVTVFTHLIQTAETEAAVRKAAELTTRLLEATPLWELTSNTVPDSTRLLLEEVFPAASAKSGDDSQDRI